MTNIYDKTIRKWIHRFNDYGVKGIFTQMDYSGMIKITDKARNEILHISFNQSKANRFEIFNLVFKVYCRICEGKEANKRWYKPYCYTRYFNRIWCRMETFKDCSW